MSQPITMNPRSARAGVIAAVCLALFYTIVVWTASGAFGHLVAQSRRDWYYLALIIGGFGVQVSLVSELRRRRRLQQATAAAGAAGMGASTVGMIACCAHHIADLAPFIGATGAATFLTNYRVPFMVIGIGVNAAGIGIAARRLLHTPSSHPHPGTGSWAHA